MQYEDMSNERIDLLVTEYLSGNLDEGSFEELKAWCRQSEEHCRYVRDRIEVWFSSGIAAGTDGFDKEEAFIRFRKRVEEALAVQAAGRMPEAAGKRDVAVQKKIYRFTWKTFYKVAAVVLVILLPLAGYWKGQDTLKGTFADMVVEAPMGARTKLYLPDGTLVWLNAGSRIIYSQGFGMDERRLELEGEGYFEVVKNKDLPFEIHTQEVGLRVLGTKFNFRNYPDDEEVTVNLLEGKISLHNGIKVMPELYLDPDEKMVMNKQTGEMVKMKSRAENSMLWTQDELFFDEELLADIAKKLMRSYNVRIEIADSLRDRRFYGSFRIMGNTIDEVLESIASTNRMKYRYENERYILY